MKNLNLVAKKHYIIVLASIVLILGIWFSSGTLTPHAVGLPNVIVTKPCQYLLNPDNGNYFAVFKFLDGAPKSTWQGSAVLERILLPLVSYPLMKLLGFVTGGVITNIFVHLLLLFSFWVFVIKRTNRFTANLGIMLLATYPGITYWAGLPYSYASIVPCSLWSYMLLIKIEESEIPYHIFLYSFVMGILFLGYNIFVYFVPATFFLLFCRRKFKLVVPVVVFQMIPSIVLYLLMTFWWKIDPVNANNVEFPKIIKSYLSIPYLSKDQFSVWMGYILELPSIILKVFFNSNFQYLPLLFIFIYLLNFIKHKISLDGKLYRYYLPFSLSEKCFLLSTLLLFLFNHMAPPYTGWQMRGEWIARIYQPLFVVLLIYSLRKIFQMNESLALIQSTKSKYIWPFLMAIALNANVIFGQLYDNPLSYLSYIYFYRHGGVKIYMIREHYFKYGRRPVGFCKKDSLIITKNEQRVGGNRIN